MHIGSCSLGKRKVGYIYLASPYSHKDPFIRELRYLRAMEAVVTLMKRGTTVYSPIVHCHELAKIADLPRDADWWEQHNFNMLAGAVELHVLTLPNWIGSIGIGKEILRATELSKPIIYLEESAVCQTS